VLSATFDTNIYVSALNFGGIPLRLLNMARDGVIRLDISEALFEDAPSFIVMESITV
jgi:hypothetical protein